MNVLAVLVNFGTEQLSYLERVVHELKSFKKYNVHVIVHSNIDIDNPNIDEVKVITLSNYQRLPITCRKTIWENRDNYDLFIYGENDHLFLEHHLDKHVEYAAIIPEDRLTGLIQIEISPEGKYYYPAYHARYDWDMNSVEEHGGKKFAHFTNLHQATFILTRDQLLRAGEGRDFTAFIDKSHYSAKCRTNTDIYQFCGMKKLICISEFNDNLIHHLPNIYMTGAKGRLRLGSWHEKMEDKIKT